MQCNQSRPCHGFFEPDTKYVYQYTDNYSDNGDTVWSAEYTYTTHATDTFSVILTGDPQIGASGSKSDKDTLYPVQKNH